MTPEAQKKAREQMDAALSNKTPYAITDPIVAINLATDLRMALDALDRVRALADEFARNVVAGAERLRAALDGTQSECIGDCDEGYGMCDACTAAGRCPLQHSEDGPRKCPRCQRPAATGGAEGSGQNG